MGPGQSIKYIANEKSKDPKVMGIVANLISPRASSGVEAAEAGKMALGIIPNAMARTNSRDKNRIANEKSKDPKVMGIVANGYPTKTLAELGVNSKYEAWYATKIALWCYLLSNWDISALSVNPDPHSTVPERTAWGWR